MSGADAAQKPLALYSNLPRLVEAVVKSLDPNSNADRDAVLDSATEILGHIVDRLASICPCVYFTLMTWIAATLL